MESQSAVVPYRAQDADQKPGKAAAAKEGLIEECSYFFGTQLLTFLSPLIWQLHVQVDKRIVRTFIQAIETILSFRDRANGLLLSELGDAMVSRRKGGKPWYLLTNEPGETADDAWRVALMYIRRGPIELAIQNVKSEMAIASPRVYEWEVRLKLLGWLLWRMPF